MDCLTEAFCGPGTLLLSCTIHCASWHLNLCSFLQSKMKKAIKQSESKRIKNGLVPVTSLAEDDHGLDNNGEKRERVQRL